MSKKNKYDSWQLLALRDGYSKYLGNDGGVWYVPRTDSPCPDCEGGGQLWTGFCNNDEDGEYDDCMMCDGTGWIETEHFDDSLILSEDDYRTVTRQERYLNRRYGRIPAHIADYWKG